VPTASWHLLHRTRGAASRLRPDLTVEPPAHMAMALEDHVRLIEDWQDEASQAALDGNPTKAHTIESYWIARLVGP